MASMKPNLQTEELAVIDRLLKIVDIDDHGNICLEKVKQKVSESWREDDDDGVEALLGILEAIEEELGGVKVAWIDFLRILKRRPSSNERRPRLATWTVPDSLSKTQRLGLLGLFNRCRGGGQSRERSRGRRQSRGEEQE